jgi:hypothetical protein
MIYNGPCSSPGSSQEGDEDAEIVIPLSGNMKKPRKRGMNVSQSVVCRRTN